MWSSRLHLWFVMFCLSTGPMALGGAANASSSKVDMGGNGGADKAFDADLSTAWVEAGAGLGKGEWLELRLPRARKVTSITLFAGNFKSSRAFRDDAHARRVEVSWTGKAPGATELEIPDDFRSVRVPVGGEITSLKITLLSAWDGARSSHVHIAEIALDYGIEDPVVLANFTKWKSKGPGLKVAEHEHTKRQAVLDLAAKGESTPEGLTLLMDLAARGDNVMRTWLRMGEMPGFAMTYLRADLQAVEALRRLRPPEALEAIEQAYAREWDEAQARSYLALAKWFRAYEVLKRPPPAAVPYWGAPGTVPGTFQSLGEPLSVAAASDGSVYVADVGNNRLQRFSAEGRVTNLTPGERTIDDHWYGEPVDPFVVGAGSGDGPGRFIQPVYVTVVPSKEGERVVAIDTSLRVQVFDLELRPLAAWKLPVNPRVETGIGLMWPLVSRARPGEVAAFVGRDVFVYDLSGHELRQFKVEGEPRAVGATPKRLLLAFDADEVISYTFDGARDKVFYRLPADDTSEDMDITVDDLGRLIVHTDEGRLYQLDKKGRLVSGQRSFSEPVFRYRIAARGGIVYITSKETIHRFELDGG